MNFKPKELIEVSLNFSGDPLKVGRLAWHNGEILFEYHQDFIDSALEVSPFKLPLTRGVCVGPTQPFEGLFGVFNDSLPDGWGRLLIDRQIASKGIAYQQLTPLDRLAFVGDQGLGALTYAPVDYPYERSVDEMQIESLAREAQLILDGELDRALDDLLQLAGSSAGARPKVLIGYDEHTNHLVPGHSSLRENYTSWIVKFPSSSDQTAIGRIEYAYSLMAKAAGVIIPETRLFLGKKKTQAYFGIKRFDRVGNRRFHVHSASGLLHADHRLPTLDYENLMRCTMALCRSAPEVTKVFRLAAFNVFAHNQDDHSKNFSFLMDPHGQWSFAPAYDLTFSYGVGGEHSATVMREGKNPGTRELLDLAKKFQIKEADSILDSVKDVVNRWDEWAALAELDLANTQTIGKVLRTIS